MKRSTRAITQSTLKQQTVRRALPPSRTNSRDVSRRVPHFICRLLPSDTMCTHQTLWKLSPNKHNIGPEIGTKYNKTTQLLHSACQGRRSRSRDLSSRCSFWSCALGFELEDLCVCCRNLLIVVLKFFFPKSLNRELVFVL